MAMDEQWNASAKSAYNTIQWESRFSSCKANIEGMSTFKMLKKNIWILLKNKIKMVNQLQIRKWPNNYFCQLCDKNLKTA